MAIISVYYVTYGNEPALWRDDLVGIDRQRCIINAFTRLRFCDQDGRMDFSIKEGSGQAPAHLMPWFDVPQRQTQDHTILFGHWSMLGLVIRDKLISLDTGCVGWTTDCNTSVGSPSHSSTESTAICAILIALNVTTLSKV